MLHTARALAYLGRTAFSSAAVQQRLRKQASRVREDTKTGEATNADLNDEDEVFVDIRQFGFGLPSPLVK